MQNKTLKDFLTAMGFICGSMAVMSVTLPVFLVSSTNFTKYLEKKFPTND